MADGMKNQLFNVSAWTVAEAEIRNYEGNFVVPAGPPDSVIFRDKEVWATSVEGAFRQALVMAAQALPEKAKIDDVRFSIKKVEITH